MSTDTFVVIVAAIVCVVFFGMFGHAIARDYGRPAFARWTRRRRHRQQRTRAPSHPEWCTECGEVIHNGWAISDTFANDGELAGQPGGTGMSAYWCDRHRPFGAVPWRS